MFQLRPPSVRPVVSGPGPDVNKAPAFVLAPPPQETSPVWPLCITKHAYPMAIDVSPWHVAPFKATQIVHKGQHAAVQERPQRVVSCFGSDLKVVAERSGSA